MTARSPLTAWLYRNLWLDHWWFLLLLLLLWEVDLWSDSQRLRNFQHSTNNWDERWDSVAAIFHPSARDDSCWWDRWLRSLRLSRSLNDWFSVWTLRCCCCWNQSREQWYQFYMIERAKIDISTMYRLCAPFSYRSGITGALGLTNK